MTAQVEEQIAAARAGSVRALARLLTVVEHGGPGAAAVARALIGVPRSAQILGVTGAPGAGKSTVTAALLRHLRTGEKPSTVAVLAIDPSSPFTGGALLGDRVRMADFATDPGVFIRSLSSRGHLGGLSAGAPAAVDLVAALGFEQVIIETVGVGQSEVDVMDLADTVAVILAPGMGDAVQAAKAGIMEIADILVVNKADHDGARDTARELRATVALGSARQVAAGWSIPVVSTVAVADDGVAALVAAIAEHRAYLLRSGELARRAERRAGAAISAIISERLRLALAGERGQAQLARAAGSVINGTADAYRAADELWRLLLTAP